MSFKDFITRDKNPAISLFRANGYYIPYIQWAFTLITVIALFIFPLKWVALWFVMQAFVTCFGVVCTHHKLLTHEQDWKYRWKWLEYVGAWFGACGGTGSAAIWRVVHNYHHANSDQPNDPHPPGLNWKLLISGYNGSNIRIWNARNILKDKFHKLIHDYYFGLLLAYGVILFLISPPLAIFGFVAPMASHIWISNIAIWRTHQSGNRTNGYRNFNTPDRSVNDWLFGLFMFGEGWHNNHHAEPMQWNNQVKWWEVDTSSWLIRLLKAK